MNLKKMRTLTGTTTLSQREPGSNSNEKVFHIPKSFKTKASPTDCLVSYPRHLLQEVLPLGRNAVSVFYSPS